MPEEKISTKYKITFVVSQVYSELELEEIFQQVQDKGGEVLREASSSLCHLLLPASCNYTPILTALAEAESVKRVRKSIKIIKYS